MWEPVDWIALVLASGVAIIMIFTAVAFMVIPWVLKQPISEERSKNVATIMIALIALLGTYLGARLQQQ